MMSDERPEVLHLDELGQLVARRRRATDDCQNSQDPTSWRRQGRNPRQRRFVPEPAAGTAHPRSLDGPVQATAVEGD
jgi:hypothetical protein